MNSVFPPNQLEQIVTNTTIDQVRHPSSEAAVEFIHQKAKIDINCLTTEWSQAHED